MKRLCLNLKVFWHFELKELFSGKQSIIKFKTITITISYGTIVRQLYVSCGPARPTPSAIISRHVVETKPRSGRDRPLPRPVARKSQATSLPVVKPPVWYLPGSLTVRPHVIHSVTTTPTHSTQLPKKTLWNVIKVLIF